MRSEFTVSYLKCQSCTAKIHCAECAEELRARLLPASGAQTAQIDLINHTAAFEGNFDADDLPDLMEDAGLFAD